MNHKLLLSTIAVIIVSGVFVYHSGLTAWAQATEAKSASNEKLESKSNTDSGNRSSSILLRKSAYRLKSCQPLQAAVRHQIELFDQKLTGTGSYMQAGQGSHKTKLDITFAAGDFKSKLTQINDGRFLYIRDQSNTQAPMQRIDLAHVETNPQESNQTSTGMSRWMAMGGLAYLIEQLERDFEFSKPLVSKLDEIEIFVIEGKWRPERISAICQNRTVVDQNGNLIYKNLPAQMPTHVRIALGKNEPLSLFPHQIVYQRYQEASSSGLSPRLKTIATFEFHDVQPAKNITAATFQIKEDSTRLSDITHSVFQVSDKESKNDSFAVNHASAITAIMLQPTTLCW